MKYIYADDIAILTKNSSTYEIEDILSRDLHTIDSFLHCWRLKLNASKTVTSVFHLKNRSANRTLNVSLKGNALKFDSNPKYLGVTLDRSLTYKEHLHHVAAKINARNSLLYRLAGSRWGAKFNVLRCSSLALCFSCAEYCSPIWSHSTHVKKVDAALNDSMRLISGCIRVTPADILPVLSGIAEDSIRS